MRYLWSGSYGFLPLAEIVLHNTSLVVPAHKTHVVQNPHLY